jgi:bacillolysin
VNGTWTTVTGLPWVNGATRTMYGTSTKVFGGDSHGYGSSQVDLTSLAGQTVRMVFRVNGDDVGSFYGWWLDDLRLYTCSYDVASAPATTVTAATTTAKVAWTTPAHLGSTPIASYRITRSDGKVNTAAASARSISLTGLKADTNVTIAVAAVDEDGHVGVPSSVPVYATTSTVTAPATAKKAKAFTVTAKVVRRGTSSVISGMTVTLQRRLKGKTAWTTVGTSGATSAKGTRSWSVKESSTYSYRVVSKGVRTYLGSTGTLKTVTAK